MRAFDSARRCDAVYGRPDPDKADIEEYRRRLETILRDLTRETDEHFEEIYAEAKPVHRLPPLEAPAPSLVGETIPATRPLHRS